MWNNHRLSCLISQQLESDLKRASVQRDEVDNHLTSVTLQKDALFDEVTHVRKEMTEIRAHLDRVCEDNAQLSKNRWEKFSRCAHFKGSVQLGSVHSSPLDVPGSHPCINKIHSNKWNNMFSRGDAFKPNFLFEYAATCSQGKNY